MYCANAQPFPAQVAARTNGNDINGYAIVPKSTSQYSPAVYLLKLCEVRQLDGKNPKKSSYVVCLQRIANSYTFNRVTILLIQHRMTLAAVATSHNDVQRLANRQRQLAISKLLNLACVCIYTYI